MVVIADDITGAAEIAGMAKAAGVTTRLVMVTSKTPETSVVEAGEVLVLATDCRQMPQEKAAELVGQLAKTYSGEAIFKKTDSVLRGHISAECEAILRNTDYEKLLLVPQNPSKGRVVRGGIYYINDVPLNETSFAFDPEFPAKTAAVGRLGVPDAESFEDVARLVSQADAKTLLAGGADLFAAVLRKEEQKLKSEPTLVTNPLLMICGSTQSKSVIDTPLCRSYRSVECNMPEDVFLGKAGAKAWIAEIKNLFPDRGIVLTINHPPQGGKAFAARLRKTMAETVKGLLSDRPYKGKLNLIIEGGATAFEILSALGWTAFTVSKEHFPGVVELENEHVRVILKPGSYPWKGLLDNTNC